MSNMAIFVLIYVAVTYVVDDLEFPFASRVLSPRVDGHERPVDEAHLGVVVHAM